MVHTISLLQSLSADALPSWPISLGLPISQTLIQTEQLTICLRNAKQNQQGTAAGEYRSNPEDPSPSLLSATGPRDIVTMNYSPGYLDETRDDRSDARPDERS